MNIYAGHKYNFHRSKSTFRASDEIVWIERQFASIPTYKIVQMAACARTLVHSEMLLRKERHSSALKPDKQPNSLDSKATAYVPITRKTSSDILEQREPLIISIKWPSDRNFEPSSSSHDNNNNSHEPRASHTLHRMQGRAVRRGR